MQYKGYYVKITPDQSLIREAENGTDIMCEGFRIEVFTDGSVKEKLDEFSAAVNYELLENSMREAAQFAKDCIECGMKEYYRNIDGPKSIKWTRKIRKN